MPTPNLRARLRAARGFTLLELLVVLIIAALLMGVVAFNAMPGERQALQNEAQRIALLLQLARDEAIVRNRPIAFEADNSRYRFLIREENQWQLLGEDDLLREREFSRAPVALSIVPAVSADNGPLRIVFGREPVDRPFLLTLAMGNSSVAIRADGVGHFTVE
ncbi:GspH/FimT family protein [Noviherbaspirillum sp. CPCC 100848]|uniref:Type II secretion system protein H n=1 Tax=Noviherbaspirillum album TaxID=3080276 RepID=A0ABU6JG12_9BURK|nr:GspH/FimT family protein [Noviherbaspirillum sp. CPCC 100848]MEC4722602.1 GspH/FimT family protein [Noviherbaspirillum sp. CPCC 100848]